MLKTCLFISVLFIVSCGSGDSELSTDDDTTEKTSVDITNQVESTTETDDSNPEDSTEQTNNDNPDSEPSSGNGSVSYVYEQNFNGDNIPANFALENSTYGDGNNELQCYTHGQVFMRDGKIVLRAQERSAVCPNEISDYASGMVRIQDLEVRPGQYIETRIKFSPYNPNNQAGLWPAFWFSSWVPRDDQPLGWPAGGEVDVFEVQSGGFTDKVNQGIHYMNPDKSKDKSISEMFLSTNGFVERPLPQDHVSVDISDEWHTYGLSYCVGGPLKFTIDQKVSTAIQVPQTLSPSPFNYPLKGAKFNLAVGGGNGWNPMPENGIFPGGEVELDYIRVSSQPPAYAKC